MSAETVTRSFRDGEGSLLLAVHPGPACKADRPNPRLAKVRGVAWRRRAPRPPRGRHRVADAAQHVIEIYLYGAADPIRIPLRRTDRAGAEAYLELIKSDVIDAQRQGRRRLLLRPINRQQATTLAVYPSKIQRMALVDHLSTPRGDG